MSVLQVSDDLRRRMHQEHRTLRALQEDMLDVFEDFCDGPTQKLQDTILGILHDFSVSVRRHFEFEEVGGYMSVVTKRRPHHTVEVERLRAEHKEIDNLLVQLDSDLQLNLIDDSEALERAKSDFISLIRKLGRHEQAETELMMEVFWLEGGVAE